MSFAIDETTIALLCTSIATAVALSYKNTPSDVPNSRLICQSYVAKTRNKGETAIYRSRSAMVNLRYLFLDGVKTPYQGFLKGCLGRESLTCFKWRSGNGSIEEMTYGKVSDKIKQFGSGLIEMGVQPQSMVLICLPNTPESIIIELACYAYSYVPVIVPESLDDDIVGKIINENKIKTVCITLDRYSKIADSCIDVQFIVPEQTEEKEKLTSQSKVEKKGVDSLKTPIPELNLDTLSCVVYTSGTTGFPKGVALSRKNQLAMSTSIICNWSSNAYPNEKDVFLTNLSQSLVTVKSSIFMMISIGGTVAFYNESDGKFFDFISSIKPTILASSARFWKKLNENLKKSIEKSGSFKKYLFNHATEAKRQSIKDGILHTPLWDSLIFEYVKEILGGKVNTMLTICGPTDPSVSENLRLNFGCNLIEIYDLTEVGPVALTIFGDYITDHSGPPSPCNEIKLVDVIDLGMLATDQPNPRGEICIRGYSVYLGYLKGGEVVKEGFDEDGFFHTGDIGEWTPQRTLKVIDRKKNFVRVINGEWVALERLERIYSKSRFVSQILIYVNQEMTLSCVIVPEFESLLEWATEKQLTGVNLENLCEMKEVQEAVISSLNQIHNEQGLNSSEKISEVRLDTNTFESRGIECSNQRLKRSAAKSILGLDAK